MISNYQILTDEEGFYKDAIVLLLRKSNLTLEGELVRKNILEYVDKLYLKSTLWLLIIDTDLVGFIAFYNNDNNNINAYLSMLLISENYRNKGLAQNLLYKSIDYLRKQEFINYNLQVSTINKNAIAFYKKHHFKITEADNDLLKMTIKL